MSGLASDEVAEDYKNSLEDLTTNDKFQISNLTVIAKENTEHAMAISRVLENHIRSVGASSPLIFRCPFRLSVGCMRAGEIEL
jgi:pre-mRNA cleavage complex 2 protein Pcf11